MKRLFVAWLLLVALPFAPVSFAAPDPHQAKVALTTTSARSSNIGIDVPVVIWCTVACYVSFGNSSVTVSSTSHGLYLEAYEKWPDKTRSGRTYIAAATVAGTGDLFISYDP